MSCWKAKRQTRLIGSLFCQDKMPGLCFLDTENINPTYWVFGILAKDKAATLKDFKARGPLFRSSSA